MCTQKVKEIYMPNVLVQPMKKLWTKDIHEWRELDKTCQYSMYILCTLLNYSSRCTWILI